MRREGCEDGFWWATVPSGTCAKAVCICHSVNMEWGVKENRVAVITFHNCVKSHSQIFELGKPLKIS